MRENFNPREFSNASGPLFGVQFSQLSCSDLMQRVDNGTGEALAVGSGGRSGGLPL